MATGTPPTSASGWPVTGLCMPSGLTISDGVIYAPHIVDDGGQQVWVLKINPDGTSTDYPILGNDTANALASDDVHLYISSYGEETQISKRLLTDVSSVASFIYEPWGTGVFVDDGFGGSTETMATAYPPSGIVCLGNYIYALHADDGYNQGPVISRINKSTFTLDTSFGGSSQGYFNIGIGTRSGFTTDGTYLYIGNNTSMNILRINDDATGSTVFKAGLSKIINLSFLNGYIYVSHDNTIEKIQVSNPSNMTTVVSSGLDYPREFAVDAGKIYVANASNSQRSNFPITLTGFIGRYNDGGGGGGGVACFKENTQILTNRGYIHVQDLKRGDLVQTLKHGLKPICLLGKSHILHHSESSSKDKLYICSKSKYPEVFEDLVMTGSHALLVNSLTQGEKEAVKTFYGKLFITDPMYRFPVSLDTRAEIYEDEGEHTIYHIALENDDLFKNYGIYANGLLVESCSKNYLKNWANMIL
jgi:hypothetical protein